MILFVAVYRAYRISRSTGSGKCQKIHFNGSYNTCQASKVNPEKN